MNTFEIAHRFGSPEAMLQVNDDFFVEIVNFIPSEMLVNVCVPHHQILSWVFPQPVVGQACFCSSGAPDLQDMGNLQFIPANTPTISRFPPEAGPRRGIIFRFAPELLDGLVEDRSFRLDPESMANLNFRDPHIQNGMRQLAEEALAPGFACATMVESIGTTMLVRLIRRYKQCVQEGRHRGGMAPWQMRRINERIADKAATPPTIAELAALIGISTGHLQQVFKESTGRTIGEHLRSVRFERARALLSGTSLPLKEISAQLGFSSQYGFTVAFQRCAGETPSAFRMRNC